MRMALDLATLPKNIAALTALLLSENAARLAAEARTLDLDGQIAHLKLTIAKMQRDTHGASSEKGARLLGQMELQFDELVATVAEGKAAAAVEAVGPVHHLTEVPQFKDRSPPNVTPP